MREERRGDTRERVCVSNTVWSEKGGGARGEQYGFLMARRPMTRLQQRVSKMTAEESRRENGREREGTHLFREAHEDVREGL